MTKYFLGYYCRNELDLELMNKSSNRYILEALTQAYPSGMTAHQLEEKTRLPLKTIYSQLKELCRESYTLEIDNRKQPKPRGRPSSKIAGPPLTRHRGEVIVEDTSNLFYSSGFINPRYEEKGRLAPGNVDFSNDFQTIWYESANKQELDEINSVLLGFVRKMLRRAINSGSLKEILPAIHIEQCCYQCGLNHEARDFIRAILIRMIDSFETSKQYLEILKENDFLTEDAHTYASSRIAGEEKLEKIEHEKGDLDKSTKSRKTVANSNLKVEEIEGIGPTTARHLREAGYSSLKDLAISNVEDLAVEINCTKDSAAEFIIAAQILLREPNILEKGINCSECGRKFDTVLQLSRHKIIKHKTIRY